MHLKMLRKQHPGKLSQRDFAKILGIGAGTYALYETGERVPSLGTFVAIADFYNVPVDFILGRVRRDVPALLDDVKSTPKKIIRRMKEARSLYGWNQREAAKQYGIDYKSLNNYENGVRLPPSQVLISISEKTGFSIDYLLCRSNVKKIGDGIKTMNDRAKEIHYNAMRHGWWDEERPFAEIVALCHSELSEALEEARKGADMVYAGIDGKPEGIAVEMADCLIRILDWFDSEDLDVEEIVELKHEFNKTRPYKHGKRF